MITETKVKKWGNSLAIRLPKKVVADFEWEDDSIINFIYQDKKVIIEPVKNKDSIQKKNLYKKLNKISSKSQSREIDWGDNLGQEIW